VVLREEPDQSGSSDTPTVSITYGVWRDSIGVIRQGVIDHLLLGIGVERAKLSPGAK